MGKQKTRCKTAQVICNRICKKYTYLFDYVENIPESVRKEVEKQWLFQEGEWGHNEETYFSMYLQSF